MAQLRWRRFMLPIIAGFAWETKLDSNEDLRQCAVLEFGEDPRSNPDAREPRPGCGVECRGHMDEVERIIGLTLTNFAVPRIGSPQEVVVEFSSNNFRNVSGYQFTLEPENLGLRDIRSGTLPLNNGNFGVFNHGTITTSWNSAEGISAD